MSILDVRVDAPATVTGPPTRAQRLQRIRAGDESAAHPLLDAGEVWNTFREIERLHSRLAALHSGFLPDSAHDADVDAIWEAIADGEALLLDGR